MFSTNLEISSFLSTSPSQPISIDFIFQPISTKDEVYAHPPSLLSLRSTFPGLDTSYETVFSPEDFHVSPLTFEF